MAVYLYVPHTVSPEATRRTFGGVTFWCEGSVVEMCIDAQAIQEMMRAMKWST